MKLASYWHDTAPTFTGGDPGPVGGRVDVAVIGGGFTGLSAALALSKRGASVAVLEAEHVGAGASGRNGGQCNNGFAQDFSAVEARFGFDKAVALYRAFDAAVDTVERLVAEERIDCGFARTGKLKLAAKAAHCDKLERARDVLHRGADPDAVFVPRNALAGEIGSARYHAGLLLPKSGSLHMGRFVVGLAEAATRRGARIHEGAAVRRLARIGRTEAHDVETTRGTLRAGQVLLATGPSMKGAVLPIPPTHRADRQLHRRHRAARARAGRRAPAAAAYVHDHTDRRPLFPGNAGRQAAVRRAGRASPCRARPRTPRAAPFSKPPCWRCFRNWPARGSIQDWCWGGIVDMTADRLPRAGEHNGLYYSMGYSGHGTQMATHMGQVMAAVMAGERDANPWAALDWPAIRGHFGPPWFLPLVGAWYRLQDQLQ